jgi:hypothetical protein
MEKKCHKCGEVKSNDLFGISKVNRDGYQRWCKKCHSNYFKEHRIENAEYQKRFSKSDKGKESLKRRQKRYREKYPEKAIARDMINNRIKSNRILKEPCVICGLNYSEAHHYDYGKPTDVIWLCNKHHLEMHHKVPIENSRDTL